MTIAERRIGLHAAHPANWGLPAKPWVPPHDWPASSDERVEKWLKNARTILGWEPAAYGLLCLTWHASTTTLLTSPALHACRQRSERSPLNISESLWLYETCVFLTDVCLLDEGAPCL